MRCIGRALLVGRGPLVFGKKLLLEFFVMSVGVAVFLAGTYSVLTAVSVFNLYFK